MTTAIKLDALAELREKRDRLESLHQIAVENCYTAEVRQAIAEVKAAFSDQQAALAAETESVTAEIKGETLEYGLTIAGETLMAVYNKARTTWDGKGLTGYAVAHPEIEVFKRTGKPSVSIRKVR